MRVVADDEADIIAALNALRERYDYVFTTGGIGPTHDDITADAVAKAFGVSIDVDPRARAMLLERHERGRSDAARLRMARIPAGADLVDNRVSRAPGFFIGNVIVMAGRAAHHGGDAGRGDAAAAHRREADFAQHPYDLRRRGCRAACCRARRADYADVQMGSYPYYEEGRPGAYLVLRSVDEARLEDRQPGAGSASRRGGHRP